MGSRPSKVCSLGLALGVGTQFTQLEGRRPDRGAAAKRAENFRPRPKVPSFRLQFRKILALCWH